MKLTLPIVQDFRNCSVEIGRGWSIFKAEPHLFKYRLVPQNETNSTNCPEYLQREGIGHL